MDTLRSSEGRIAVTDYFDRVRRFHGFLAPGVVLGGFMVDWALEAMEPCSILDALVETRKCLPDAVQLLIKCSTGNGWLRILDWGKLAVTLYDKESLAGARVCLDLEKLAPYTRMRAWAMKEKSRKENPLEPLIDEIVAAGRRMFTCQKVQLERVPKTFVSYASPSVCPKCGEAFRYGPSGICEGCKQPFLRHVGGEGMRATQ